MNNPVKKSAAAIWPAWAFRNVRQDVGRSGDACVRASDLRRIRSPAPEEVGEVRCLVAERARLQERIGCLPGVRVWPTQANFVLVRVPDASHWIVHEKPELVCREIETFIGRAKP